MKIEYIKLENFRNFQDATINFEKHSLIIGANDIGKSNLLYAIRIVLDSSLSDMTIEPCETDFHIPSRGEQADELKILIKLSNITEDAVLSKFKGNIDDEGNAFLCYTANRGDLTYSFCVGFSEESLEKIENRYYYLKHIHLRYIQSTRDLLNYMKNEKKHLLAIAKKNRNEECITLDAEKETSIQANIETLNKEINELSYVMDATSAINTELKNLSIHNTDYAVQLEANSIELSTYINQLSLNATSFEKNVGLGGDGRNNQILMAVWKTKSEHEYDVESEAIIYCIEEPEAHLHPHQQRKFAKYLIEQLKGQVLISSHSPQIVEHFSPNKIIRLYEENGASYAASNGCSKIIEEAWNEFGYRMSIIPAEAFFANAVFLVEGPSEVIFFNALAKAQRFDLDYLNISILSVAGISFSVYSKILKSLKIPYVARTDNDISKVPKCEKWQCAGLNRALRLIGQDVIEHFDDKPSHEDILINYEAKIETLRDTGVYLSNVDLETDIVELLFEETKKFTDKTEKDKIIEYFKKAKATKMYEFVASNYDSLKKDEIKGDEIIEPLVFLKDLLTGSR